eukprot:TRINITY_DN28191_c0_g1_i1.p2 TRINITY_DN28191_c0_g1~~TRINITY_DN28191_c0_g1_i1.p2  ORF type:complete len:199 (-),score=36.95 TRINITY_DN28191_c0_g1_i1:8-523(-)
MAMLVTLFLVLINIFNSVRENAPISSRLNAVDLYLVVCIFFVFAALLEYAAILLLLKKRRKPLTEIEGKELMSKPWQSPEENGRSSLLQSPEDNGQSALLESPGDSRQAGLLQVEEQRGQSHIPLKKHVPVGLTARKQALIDNIDAWAMWISPPVFILFNFVYWVSYRWST